MGDLRIPMDEAEFYFAPDATTFSNSLITAAPTSPWLLVANSNHRDGVTIENTASSNPIYVENSMYPKDITFSEGHLIVSSNLVDLYAETVALALHGRTSDITTVAATGTVIGTKAVPLTRPQRTPNIAFLVRSGTPYPNGTHAVLYLPRAKVTSDFSTALMRSDVGPISFSVEYVEHPTLAPTWYFQTDPTT